MHKPKSVLENETHKILWNFEIQTDHLISARRPAKENLSNNGLYRTGGPQSKNKIKKTKREIST